MEKQGKMDSTTPTNQTEIQSKLSALAARQSKGRTSDPKALTKASSKNARLPVIIPSTSADSPSPSSRQKSSKSKRKGEKMKEKAVGKTEALTNKVQQRENRKSQRERAKRAWD